MDFYDGDVGLWTETNSKEYKPGNMRLMPVCMDNFRIRMRILGKNDADTTFLAADEKRRENLSLQSFVLWLL